MKWRAIPEPTVLSGLERPSFDERLHKWRALPQGPLEQPTGPANRYSLTSVRLALFFAGIELRGMFVLFGKFVTRHWLAVIVGWVMLVALLHAGAGVG